MDLDGTVLFLLVTILNLHHNSECANILAIFPLADRSDNYLYQRLLKGLADQGHLITSISAHEFDLGLRNGSVRDVILSGFADKSDRQLKELNYEALQTEGQFHYQDYYLKNILEIYNKTLWHGNVRKFIINNKKKFDVIIIDYYWSDSLLVFSKIFKCPVIAFSNYGLIDPYTNSIAGNPLPPSYVRHPFLNIVNSYSTLSFLERTYNFINYLSGSIFNSIYLIPRHNELIRTAYKKRFKNNPPDVTTLQAKISLVLLNSHPSIRQATPLVPNAMEIAGFHIDPPEQLPEDLQDFLDGAKSGAVYFSLGLNVRTRNIPDWKKQVFMNVFKKLNLRVLWKYDGEKLIDSSPKVMLRRWVPQRDVLGHPNIKLFINNGGYNSLLEIAHFGVPSLMIPIFPENHKNALQAQDNGYALTLPYNSKNFSEEVLYALAKELLENPRYREAARTQSQLFRDRPIEPLREAIYWIEYVIRTNGAIHLRVLGSTLPFYKFYMLDVILCLISTFTVSLMSVYVCAKRLCRRKIELKIKQN
ncbi:UDP-glucosyltransferase 2-like [Euwallacea fornicatus]|uniref:UDP-glucosyltransferase 2-like n=1 Tax=Euwallacea fornicatus TaxID=995702 RepID=UPI00338FFBD4